MPAAMLAVLLVLLSGCDSVDDTDGARSTGSVVTPDGGALPARGGATAPGDVAKGLTTAPPAPAIRAPWVPPVAAAQEAAAALPAGDKCLLCRAALATGFSIGCAAAGATTAMLASGLNGPGLLFLRFLVLNFVGGLCGFSINQSLESAPTCNHVARTIFHELDWCPDGSSEHCQYDYQAMLDAPEVSRLERCVRIAQCARDVGCIPEPDPFCGAVGRDARDPLAPPAAHGEVCPAVYQRLCERSGGSPRVRHRQLGELRRLCAELAGAG
jgi:hypothetical protein